MTRENVFILDLVGHSLGYIAGQDKLFLEVCFAQILHQLTGAYYILQLVSLKDVALYALHWCTIQPFSFIDYLLGVKKTLIMHSLYKILHFLVVNLHHFTISHFRFVLNCVIWTTLNHFHPFLDGLFCKKTKLNPIPQAIFLCEFFTYLPSIHKTHIIIYIRYPREERLPAIHHDRRSLPQNAISVSKPTNKPSKDKQNSS